MDDHDIKEPDDLGIEFNTQEGKAWEQIKTNILDELAKCRRTIIMGEHDLLKVEEMIAKEKEKLK